MQILIGLGLGALFGFGILVAGMGNPAKVLNFFDFAGTWDPSLAFVMLGAIGVLTSMLVKAMLDRDPWSGLYLVMAVAVMAQATLAVIALRRLARGAGA